MELFSMVWYMEASQPVSEVFFQPNGSQLTINWNRPSNTGMGNDVRYYYAVKKNNIDIITTTSYDTSVQISNVNTGDLIRLNIQVVTTYFEASTVSTPASFNYTMPASASDPVSDVSFDYDLSNRTLQINWIAPSNTGDGINLFYSYTIRKNGGIFFSDSKETENVTVNNIDINDVIVFNITVQTFYNNTILTSNLATFNYTVPMPPPPDNEPSTPTLNSVTAQNGGLVVSFNTPANGGAPITSFTATATPVGSSTVAETVTITTSGPAEGTLQNATFTTLTNWEVYNISITATNSVGPSSALTITGIPGEGITSKTGTIYIRQTSSTADIQYSTINSTNNTDWVNLSWPVKLNNFTPSGQTLKVLFTTDLTLTSASHYFICNTDNIQIGDTSLKSDGTRRVITVSSVTNYPGLVQNGQINVAGKSSIRILNLHVTTANNSTLEQYYGWIGQRNFSNGIIVNCSSTGDIPDYGGGICGTKCLNTTIIGCYSTGIIYGLGAGGIIGFDSGNTNIYNCHSSGDITGAEAGGIAGRACMSVTVRDCFSIGLMSSTKQGGIFGNNAEMCTAERCYYKPSFGFIGNFSGGIFANTNTSNIQAKNCFNTSGVSGYLAGGIVGDEFVGYYLATNCYTSGVGALIYAGYAVNDNSNYSEYENNATTWNSANAQVLKADIGANKWIEFNSTTPFALKSFGPSPYTLNIVNPVDYSLVQTFSQTIQAGQSTTQVVIPTSSGTNNFTLQGTYDSTITINAITGQISTTQATPAGVHTLTVYDSISKIATEVVLTITAPLAPQIPLPEDLEANISSQTISLLWSQPASITDPTGLSYRVEWYAAGLLVGSHTLSDTNYDISGLTNGTQYTIKVYTVIGSNSSVAAIIIRTPIAPPSAPQNVIATSGNNQVTISWTVVAGVTYNISWAQGVTFIDSVSGLSSSPYVVTGLTNGTLYTFAISGVNAGGASSQVDVSCTPNLLTPQSAVQTGNISTFIASQPVITPETITQIRTGIKNITDPVAKAAAKDSLITAMAEKQGSTPKTIPINKWEEFKGSLDYVMPGILPGSIQSCYPNVSNVVDLSSMTDLSFTSMTYAHIEMRLNTETTLTMNIEKNGQTNSVPFAKMKYLGNGNISLSQSTNGGVNWTSYRTWVYGAALQFNNKTFILIATGSAVLDIKDSISPVPVEVNLNVEVSANGELTILNQTPTSVDNIVVASTKLPVTSLYDTSDIDNPLGLIEFWEPSPDYDEIECQLATNFKDSVNEPAYKLMAKRLALGLQNVLMGELKAHKAVPFNDTKYGPSEQENTNRVMNGFGRLALMAYSHYIMGHVQATAAITNDKQFIRNMLSLKDTTAITDAPSSLQETDYKYEVNASDSSMRIGDYDLTQKPWNVIESTTDANLAARLVKKLITENINTDGTYIVSKKTEIASNPTKVASIVKQVIGQDVSRARNDDNSTYTPAATGLLKFIPGDIIYVSISLTTPQVSVGGSNSGQQIKPDVLMPLYNPSDAHKKYTLKITLE